MKTIYLSIISLLLLITSLSCNQSNEKKAVVSSSPPVSEFKDSTSFVKGVKVFIRPLAQMKVIENVTLKQGKHYYLIGGKQYEAKDLQSLD